MSTKDLGSMSNAELGQLFNIDLGNDILDMQKDEDGSFNYEPPQLALPAPAPASIATAPPAPSPAPYVPEPLAATNVQTIAPAAESIVAPEAASVLPSALGTGLGMAGGMAGGMAAIEGAKALMAAAKSPQGSISDYLPVGGGSGQDYAGQAAMQTLMAAINSTGGIASRMGG